MAIPAINETKIGIGLLIILNLTFVYVIIIGAVLSFGLIVAPLGQERGIEIANQATNDILIKLTVLSIVVFLMNYFFSKIMIIRKNPFLTSLITTVLGLFIFIPFFLSANQSFLDYQNGITQLQHFLDGQSITEVQVITHSDTIRIEQLSVFITDIGSAKFKIGPWDYAKNMNLIFKRIDGS